MYLGKGKKGHVSPNICQCRDMPTAVGKSSQVARLFVPAMFRRFSSLARQSGWRKRLHRLHIMRPDSSLARLLDVHGPRLHVCGSVHCKSVQHRTLITQCMIHHWETWRVQHPSLTLPFNVNSSGSDHHEPIPKLSSRTSAQNVVCKCCNWRRRSLSGMAYH